MGFSSKREVSWDIYIFSGVASFWLDGKLNITVSLDKTPASKNETCWEYTSILLFRIGKGRHNAHTEYELSRDEYSHFMRTTGYENTRHEITRIP